MDQESDVAPAKRTVVAKVVLVALVVVLAVLATGLGLWFHVREPVTPVQMDAGQSADGSATPVASSMVQSHGILIAGRFMVSRPLLVVGIIGLVYIVAVAIAMAVVFSRPPQHHLIHDDPTVPSVDEDLTVPSVDEDNIAREEPVEEGTGWSTGAIIRTVTITLAGVALLAILGYVIYDRVHSMRSQVVGGKEGDDVAGNAKPTGRKLIRSCTTDDFGFYYYTDYGRLPVCEYLRVVYLGENPPFAAFGMVPYTDNLVLKAPFDHATGNEDNHFTIERECFVKLEKDMKFALYTRSKDGTVRPPKEIDVHFKDGPKEHLDLDQPGPLGDATVQPLQQPLPLQQPPPQ